MTNSETQESRKLEGIGGWLLLPAAQLILTPISLVLAIGQTLHFGITLFKFGPTVQTLVAIFVLSALLRLILLVFGIFCLVQFFRTTRRTRRLMPFWYCIHILWMATVLTGVFLAPTPGAGIPYITVMGLDIGLLIYFRVSKRVKNTFVK